MTPAPEPPAPAQPSLGHLPDQDTSEAILYGEAYSWIKSALWAWDEIEDYLLRKADSLEGQIQDRQFAYEVMTRNRYVIFSKSPRFNSPQQNQDVFTLRELLKTVATISKIRGFRRANQSWARMMGIREYVGGLRGRGITEAEWKAATADYNMDPITYDSVHGAAPETIPEEDVDWDEFMRLLLGEEEYSELASIALEGGTGEGWDGEDYDADDGEEDFGEEGGEDFGEEGGDALGEGPAGPDPIGALSPGALEAMFGDPLAAAAESLSLLDDECSESAWLWESSGSDGRSAVDALIEIAEAVRCPRRSTRTQSPT